MKTKAANAILWIFAETLCLISLSLGKLLPLKTCLPVDNGLLHSHVIRKVSPFLAYSYHYL